MDSDFKLVWEEVDTKNYLEIDPFYSIDASSGEIGNFNPIEDITFFDTFYKK